MATLPTKVKDFAVQALQKVLDHRENKDRVVLVGLRGFLPELGQDKKGNDRGIYDDAIFLIVRDEGGAITEVYRFKANTDPSVYRTGIATLITGSWKYKLGYHGYNRPYSPYRALVQAGKFTVLRDGGVKDTGFFGINIHRGGVRSTSSEGCQTIPPDAWAEFIRKTEALMKKYNQSEIVYELMNEKDREVYIK